MNEDSINPSLFKNKHGFPHLILGLMMLFGLIVYFPVKQKKKIQPVLMKIKKDAVAYWQFITYRQDIDLETGEIYTR
jgi:hypothetical protein